MNKKQSRLKFPLDKTTKKWYNIYVIKRRKTQQTKKGNII